MRVRGSLDEAAGARLRPRSPQGTEYVASGAPAMFAAS
jgi:hypothetical protein